MMEHAARAWDAIAADPLQAAVIVLASFFIVASVSVGLMFAWDEARTMPVLLAFALMLAVLAAELYKSLYITVTFKAGRFGAAVLGLPIMAVACTYSITANNKTMEKYFGKHEWRAVAESGRYKAARSEVAGLESRLGQFRDTRVTGAVKAELDGKLAIGGLGDCTRMNTRTQYRVCPTVAKLRAELAGAEERDRLESDLAIAKTKLSGLEDPSAGANGQIGPIGPALASMGIHVATFSELIGLVFTVLVEGGAILALPVLVGGRGNRGVRLGHIPAGTKLLPAVIEAEPAASFSDHGDERINQVSRFFRERCERRHGAALKTTRAWDEFCRWCAETKQDQIVKKQHFWMIATQDLRMASIDMTTAAGRGKHYQNLTIRQAQRGIGGSVIELSRAAFGGRVAVVQG